MSTAPARSFTLLAAAIVVAAIIISATLFVALGTAATVTKTSTSTITSTSTFVSTSTVYTTCIEGPANLAFGPRAANTFGPLLEYNSTNDCQLGITLGLSESPGVIVGENESFTVYLANDEPASRDVNYTGFPPLHGLDSSSPAWYDDALPLQPPCGYPSTSSFEPAFIVVYNATGFPTQLSDSPMPILNCISSGGKYHPFTASQTLNESISVGGYWTSHDAEEPWINATYSQFSPGNYTIVAFDAWQQLTELRFTVTGTGLYNVTFQQMGACSPPVYTEPWSVTLGNKTEAEPPNTPLPIANGSYSAGPEPLGIYTIVFTSVPDGVYQYKIAPSGPFYITSGTIAVNGTDLLVPVDGPAVSCTTTTIMT